MDAERFATLMRDKQQRAFEVYGTPLPAFSVWDPTVPDCRVSDPKKRGLIRSPTLGPMSPMFCVSCGRRSPYAVSESLAKALYKCLPCTLVSGHPANAAMIPGTGLM